MFDRIVITGCSFSFIHNIFQPEDCYHLKLVFSKSASGLDIPVSINLDEVTYIADTLLSHCLKLTVIKERNPLSDRTG